MDIKEFVSKLHELIREEFVATSIADNGVILVRFVGGRVIRLTATEENA